MDPSMHHVESWLSNALGHLVTSPLLWVFLACLLGVMGCLWGLLRFANFKRDADVSSESGSATLEFVLIIPMLLFCTLTLAQTTMVMGGNIFVHYAAFAATRSAITTIPLDYSDVSEPRNYLVLPDGSKSQRIRQAAVFALLPVAGRTSDSSTSESQLLVEGFKSYYNDLGQEPPAWIDNFLAERLAYANAHTGITFSRAVTESVDDLVMLPLEEGVHQFGPREPITVQVEHQLNLAVPYVWPLFADSTAARHTQVKAYYTLNNEGIDIELPPSPRRPLDFSQPLPRRD
jgi:hypothetical protein